MDEIVERLRAIPVWMAGAMTPGWQEHGTSAYEAADLIESLRAENARLTEERDAFRTMAINHLWNHNLSNAYGREEYQRQLDRQVDETLENMLAKVKREGGE